MITALIGLQWGDEGKGKVIDALGDAYDVICRFQGGANAGHTIYRGEEKIVFHQIPSGLIHPNKIGIIGPCEILDFSSFIQEMAVLSKIEVSIDKRLIIDERVHLVLPFHKDLDELEEKKKGIGTTKRGIGPCYRDMISRIGLRIGDIRDSKIFNERLHLQWNWNASLMGGRYGQPIRSIEDTKNYIFENYPEVEPFIGDSVAFLHKALKDRKRILLEGAQGTLLDVTFGTYPFVTSSHTTSGGAASQLGIPPQKIKRVIGVMKAYTTRVGRGPFPTELKNAKGSFLRKKGNEFGATTGRPRRCGWLDLITGRYSVQINGVTEIALTKLDIFSGVPEIKVCTSYKLDGKELDFPPPSLSEWFKVEPVYKTFKGFSFSKTPKSFDDLDKPAREFISFIEEFLNTPVKYISVGEGKEDFIVRNV